MWKTGKAKKKTIEGGRVLTGHLTDDGVKIHLVLVVDEPVMEHPLTLMAEEAEDLLFVSHLARLTLQDTCTQKVTSLRICSAQRVTVTEQGTEKQ